MCKARELTENTCFLKGKKKSEKTRLNSLVKKGATFTWLQLHKQGL